MLLLRIKSYHNIPETSVDFLSIMDKYLVSERIQATTSCGQAYGSYEPPSFDQVQESGPPPMVDRGNDRYNPPMNYGQPPGYGQIQAYLPPAPHQINTNQIQIVQANPGIVVVTSKNRPPNRLLLAIMVCFCCFPTGIVAIVFAYMAAREIDVKNAWDRYRVANIFIVISAVGGVVIYVAIAIVATFSQRTYRYI